MKNLNNNKTQKREKWVYVGVTQEKRGEERAILPGMNPFYTIFFLFHRKNALDNTHAHELNESTTTSTDDSTFELGV